MTQGTPIEEIMRELLYRTEPDKDLIRLERDDLRDFIRSFPHCENDKTVRNKEALLKSRRIIIGSTLRNGKVIVTIDREKLEEDLGKNTAAKGGACVCVNGVKA